MPPHQNILIVKFGAMGDVVRTSYFAKYIKACRPDTVIHWITQPSCRPLIAHNPFIDQVHLDRSTLCGLHFDVIYSLDDEAEALDLVAEIGAKRVVGAHWDGNRKPSYSADAATWFDMGLISSYGKQRADELKRENTRTHSEIFADIFQVSLGTPSFFNNNESELAAAAWRHSVLNAGEVLIGINAFAGARWPSKAIPTNEYHDFIRQLFDEPSLASKLKIVLLGAGNDAAHNKSFHDALGRPTNIIPLDTSGDVLELGAVIKSLDLLVTADSLALHLAVAQQVPVVTFFASTSAAEIENGPRIAKILSTAADYCSYKPQADNSSITAKRLIEATCPMLRLSRK
jgi:heptosyltransferase-2